jgi:hypothetical protein
MLTGVFLSLIYHLCCLMALGQEIKPVSPTELSAHITCARYDRAVLQPVGQIDPDIAHA